MNPRIRLLIPILGAFLSFGCSKETSREDGGHVLRLVFVPVANGEPLALGRQYANPLGEDYRVDVFKAYITNLTLSDGSDLPVSSTPDCFHLLDASRSGSLVIEHVENAKPFRSIRFQFGIDSVRNVSGAQTGALDPMNGMFWTWSTGYINAKLEGSSAFSPNPDKRFVYHIGGFAGAERTQRSVSLDLPGTEAWMLDKFGISEATIFIDIDKWFQGEHDLPISRLPVSMTPGPTAIRYADNIAGMFELKSMERK